MIRTFASRTGAAFDLLLQPTGANQGTVADERPLHAPGPAKGASPVKDVLGPFSTV